MKVFACPGCGVRLNVPEGTVGRFKCGKCGKVLRIEATSSQRSPLEGLTDYPLPTDATFSSGLSADLGQPAWMGNIDLASSPTYANSLPAAARTSPKRSQVAQTDPMLRTFLKRLAIGLGGFSGFLILLAGVGLFSEPVAMVAAVLGVVVGLGLIIAARVWIIVLGFGEKATQGLLVLLVPYYWLYFMFTRKGRALRALALILSSLVPMLIVFPVAYMYANGFDGLSSSQGPGLTRSQLAEIRERIAQSNQTSAEANVTRKVTFNLFDIYNKSSAHKADQILGELPGYLPGSFEIAPDRKSVSFQFRGDKSMATPYGLYLAGHGEFMLDLTPTKLE